MIRSGVFSLPAAISRFLQGGYSLLAYEGASIGNLTAHGTSGWSLSPFYSRRGGEPGDYLVLVFDIASRVARVYLGQQELIDEFRSPAQRPAPAQGVGLRLPEGRGPDEQHGRTVL